MCTNLICSQDTEKHVAKQAESKQRANWDCLSWRKTARKDRKGERLYPTWDRVLGSCRGWWLGPVYRYLDGSNGWAACRGIMSIAADLRPNALQVNTNRVWGILGATQHTHTVLRQTPESGEDFNRPSKCKTEAKMLGWNGSTEIRHLPCQNSAYGGDVMTTF